MIELVGKVLERVRKEAPAVERKAAAKDKENSAAKALKEQKDEDKTRKEPATAATTATATAAVDYNQYDLNKLSEEELAAHKKKMDELYFKNFTNPKAKGFVYDVEKNFDAVEKVDDSWDS